MKTNRIAALCFAALLLPTFAAAQWGGFLKDKVERKAKEKAGRAVDEAGNKAYEEGKKGVAGGGDEERAKDPAAEQDASTSRRFIVEPPMAAAMLTRSAGGNRVAWRL